MLPEPLAPQEVEQACAVSVSDRTTLHLLSSKRWGNLPFCRRLKEGLILPQVLFGPSGYWWFISQPNTDGGTASDLKIIKIPSDLLPVLQTHPGEGSDKFYCLPFGAKGAAQTSLVIHYSRWPCLLHLNLFMMYFMTVLYIICS